MQEVEGGSWSRFLNSELVLVAGLEGTTLYSRIRPDLPRTDPFSGLYLGTFAPHGPEILQLQRSVTEVRPRAPARPAQALNMLRCCLPPRAWNGCRHGLCAQRPWGTLVGYKTTGLQCPLELSNVGVAPQCSLCSVRQSCVPDCVCSCGQTSSWVP